MPRRPRITLLDVPLHIIQRGNNRQACFYRDVDYQAYLDWLHQYAVRCHIHAYVLMTNHVHLLLTPGTDEATGDLMKRLGQPYVQYVNRTYRRSGTLWEGRFRSCPANEEAYLLACYRYIELNPVRAGIVEHPAEYRWSSYRRNAQGEPSRMLASHAVYEALGSNEEDRRSAYRELFRDELDRDLVDQIRKATNGNYALGSPRFHAQIESALGRRATPGCPGRPAGRSSYSGSDPV